MSVNILSELATGRFINLPAPIQIGLGVLAGTTTLGLTWLVVGRNQTALLIVAAGLVFVVLLFLLFRALIKWNAKRKANPLAQGIAGNAAAAPQGISEPARRARLDDLRRNFEQGVEKFRAAGKNLYSVPWYVLVGEPGSGKTEAIRHCNVGFPPGLQDQLQGAGGTLNMNWWFTNSAIILDTAGRLMFEEVAPGSTNEWNEFLKLLRQNRPNSPVNGLLLVIPVDTLIKDSADAIEKKATKIAQQFDQIQRILGVRFPVFVIITKCDLLNGFREFFDDLNDPQLQHQIMGWSNPAPLDERFDPAKVTAHLETVKQRLMARRQNLLLDPVHTEDPQARRVDQVDALYTLPDSVTKIGPRLRRYLEMIFVAGEWSPKPLFLRGIYFTSSMTEGAALDAELAEALGVPVDSLPGGAIFRKDRAYFLRDLFLEKVFREKGLVTRASNADKQQRSRHAMVLGFAFVAVLVLFAVTWFGSRSLEKSLGAERDFWVNASKLRYLDNIAIIKNGGYTGDSVNDEVKSTLPGLFSSNLEHVKTDLQIPFIFKPMTVFSFDVNPQRRIAYRNLYEVTVLRPLYSAARARILKISTLPAAAASPSTLPASTSSAPASPSATESFDPAKTSAALVELMKLEYAVATGKPPAGPDAAHPLAHPQVELASLFALVLSEEDYQKYARDNGNLQKVADWLYTAQAQGDKDWPPPILKADLSGNRKIIGGGLSTIMAYWNNKVDEKQKEVSTNIQNVKDALTLFRDAEAKLQNLCRVPIVQMDPSYITFRDQWRNVLQELSKAKASTAAAWDRASEGKKTYAADKKAIIDSATNAYDLLKRYTVDPAAAKDGYMDAREQLDAAQKKINAWRDSGDTATQLGDQDMAYLDIVKDTDNTQRYSFELLARLYEMAGASLVQDGETMPIPGIGTLAAAFDNIEKDRVAALGKIGSLQQVGGARLTQAGSLAQFAVEASTCARKYLLADSVLKGFPGAAADWNKCIKDLAAAKDTPRVGLERPPVPLVTFPAGLDKTFNDQFSPEAAGIVLDRLDVLTNKITDKDAATKILDTADIKKRVDDSRNTFEVYRKAYIIYWRDTVKAELNFSESYTNLDSLFKKLDATSENAIYEQLTAYGDRMSKALSRIGDVDDANKIAPAISREDCKSAFSNWRNLGSDAVSARRTILSLIANDFKDNYTVPSANGNESYAARYWNSLPVAELRALVADGEKQINDGITELARYERFPLAPIGNPKDDLSLADVIAARKALEKIRGASGSAATVPSVAASSPGARLISQGGNTNNKDINDQLDRLRGTKLLAGKVDYYNQVGKFLDGLPLVDNQPFAAVFSINKTKQAEASDSIAFSYSYMKLLQGGKLLHDFTLSATNLESNPVDYPGTDISFVFRQNRENTPTSPSPDVQPQIFPGPWAVLRLVNSDQVNPNSLAVVGNKWTLEYFVTTPDAKRRSLWLTLEFKQPLPELKDWPNPKAKAP